MSKTLRIVLLCLVTVSLLLAALTGCTLMPDEPNVSDAGLKRIAEARQVIMEHAIDRDDLDTDMLSEAAVRGMLEALDDPYAVFLDVTGVEHSTARFEGKTGGIGAIVSYKDEQLVIVSPNDGSPAEAAGILAGDIIVAINGDPVSEMSYFEAVLKVRGKVGDPVTLLVQHEGDAGPVSMTVVRAEIELTSVRLEMKEDIAYIRIANFSERTGDELADILAELTAKDADGIILDLRSNPGGRLMAVIEVVSQFLESGLILSVEDNNGAHTEYKVRPGFQVNDLPVVILVDEFTASGGEVLSGVLQYYGRATVAGITTFGKGSVNQLFELSDGTGIYVTIARWLLPDGRRIEGEGITPDRELDLAGDDAVNWAIDYLQEEIKGSSGSG